MNNPIPIDDGGPAFPETRWSDEHRQEVQWQGMTLRDWFAGQALCGLVQDPNMTTSRRAAEGAYDIADEMIRARKTTP